MIYLLVGRRKEINVFVSNFEDADAQYTSTAVMYRDVEEILPSETDDTGSQR